MINLTRISDNGSTNNRLCRLSLGNKQSEIAPIYIAVVRLMVKSFGSKNWPAELRTATLYHIVLAVRWGDLIYILGGGEHHTGHDSYRKTGVQCHSLLYKYTHLTVHYHTWELNDRHRSIYDSRLLGCPHGS